MAKENYQIYIKCTLYILKEHQGGIYSSLSLWIVMIQYDDRKQWESMSYLYYRKWCQYSAQLQCILVECGPLIDNTFLILMNYSLLVVTWSVILQIIYQISCSLILYLGADNACNWFRSMADATKHQHSVGFSL